LASAEQAGAVPTGALLCLAQGMVFNVFNNE